MERKNNSLENFRPPLPKKYAFKLNQNENHKCRMCGCSLPPYLTKYHKALVFTKEQTETLDFGGGQFVEYDDSYPTINIFEEECKDKIEQLKNENQFLKDEIERLKGEIKLIVYSK